MPETAAADLGPVASDYLQILRHSETFGDIQLWDGPWRVRHERDIECHR